MKTRWLAIEAALCALPCFLPAMGGLPILLFGAIRSLAYDPGAAAYGLVLVGGLGLALFQYLVLALQTIHGRPYRFGLAFFLAAGSALAGVWWAGRSFGATVTAIAIGPIVAATAHFVILQMRRREA